MSIDWRLKLSCYLVTDRSVLGDKTLVSAVGEALEGGVRAVQLREKDLGAGELLKLARELREVTAAYGALLIINDRLDVALGAGADGLHLGQVGLSPADVRPYLAGGMKVGVSTHSLEEALLAEAEGADYITFGPIFPTPSKERYGEPVGLERLGEAAKKINVPLVAIGGIKRESVNDIALAGADGLAVISAILSEGGGRDIRGNARTLVEACNESGSQVKLG